MNQTTAGTVEYHWIMTLQSAPSITSTQTWTLVGTRSFDVQTTRAQMYEQLLAQCRSALELPDAALVTLFFSAEPNRLGAVADGA